MQTLKPGMSHKEVLAVRSILRSQGYDVPADGEEYDRETLAPAVHSFQASHDDKNGVRLVPDCIIGPATWWALENPSGAAQRAFHKIKPAAKTVPGQRGLVVKAALEWWKKPTFEKPDGSNWGGAVAEILANAGGPRPWCMHFVSRVFKDALGAYPLGKDHGLVAGFWNAAKRAGIAHLRGAYKPKPGDVAVSLTRNKKGQLTGTGHVWFCVATGFNNEYNSIGGNEGNRVKLATRNTADPAIEGWVNLFGDDGEKMPESWRGLIAERGEESELSFAGTR